MVKQMSLIQEEFNTCTGDLILSPGEYEGPLIIDRPCVVDGQHSTIWADSGPVVTVDAASVTLKNLRIEVTGSRDLLRPPVSLKLNRRDTQLDNVEINGTAEGLPGEKRGWCVPGLVSLGDFAANRENHFSLELDAPRDAEIVHSLKDVVITPQKLRPGRNVLTISTPGMRDNTILFGELLIKTDVARRICLMGKARKGAPEHTAGSPVLGRLTVSAPLDPPDEAVAPFVSGDSRANLVRRGQRLPLDQMQKRPIKLVYSHRATRRPLTVDPYVFLLDRNGKVRSDQDLVFFGNEEAPGREVRVRTDGEKALAIVDLPRVSKNVEKIAVCLSIYDDQSGAAFDCVEEPVVRLFSEDREQFRFSLDFLRQEKTVVAAEFYRYKGEWKVNFIGGGFTLGLDALCREYGVDVE